MAKTTSQKKESSTTIKLSEATKTRLDHVKEYPGESYDSIVNKTLNILNICLRSPSLAARILRDIEKSKKRKELIEHPESVITKKKPVTSSIPRNLETNIQRLKNNISTK